jgi:hypothetical protein
MSETETSWPNVSQACIKTLKEASKKLMDDLMSKWDTLNHVSLTNLSDCICAMIYYRTTEMTVAENNATQIPHTLHDMFVHVLTTIRLFDKRLREILFNRIKIDQTPGLTDAAYITSLFKNIYKAGTNKVFPSLQSPIHGGAPQMTVLMMIIGTALVNRRSAKILERCMHKEWMVPIVDARQVHGIAIDRLHPGTYISGSGSRTWFHENGYLVGTRYMRVNIRTQYYANLILSAKAPNS